MSDPVFSGLSDEMLVDLFRSGRAEDCFAELFERHHSTVFRHCMGIVRNRAEADELTQQTFLTAFKKLDLFHGGHFELWLLKIARNICLNYVRPAMREAPLRGSEPKQIGISGLQLAEAVRTSLTHLTEKQRLAVKLFYIEGYSYKEVGLMMSCSVREVKTLLQTGRRRFRSAWEAAAPERSGNDA